MTKLFKIALAAAVLATGAFAAERAHAVPVSAQADQSDLYGGFDPNSPAGNRAFWDNLDAWGN